MRVVNTDGSVERFGFLLSDVNPRSERERSGVGRDSGWISLPTIPQHHFKVLWRESSS